MPPRDLPGVLQRVFEETHPAQVAVFLVVFVLDVVGLLLLNRRKRRQQQDEAARRKKTSVDGVVEAADHQPLSWRQRRWAYWVLMAASVAMSWWLDAHYEIHDLLVPAKSYVMAFPLGLLDLHFSNTAGVPMQVIAGAALWCSTIYFRMAFTNAYFGRYVPPVLVQECSLWILLRELARFVLSLPLVGMLSDLIFSPMHRLAHHPKLYKEHHKVHHEYTNQLTALVLYHGALLDDFLMPFSTSIGGLAYTMLLGLVGLEQEGFSNVAGYLMVLNTLLSHAHDTRCARLLAPLPDDLNFVAYHYVHHLSPCHNFGLTKPSDLIWDRLLGVSTIRRLEDFEGTKNLVEDDEASLGVAERVRQVSTPARERKAKKAE